MRFPAVWYRVGSAAKRHLIFTVEGPTQRAPVDRFNPPTQGSAMRSHQHRTPETPRLRRRLFRKEERASLAAHMMICPFRGCTRGICAVAGPQSGPPGVYALGCALPRVHSTAFSISAVVWRRQLRRRRSTREPQARRTKSRHPPCRRSRRQARDQRPSRCRWIAAQPPRPFRHHRPASG